MRYSSATFGWRFFYGERWRMLEWLAVLVGGSLGGMGRLALGNLVGRWLGSRLPWGTLAVNLSGALAMGLVAAAFGLPGG
ncbi:MAG: fluoride efflux transporter FluC, partial [Halomonas sp.]